MPPVCSGSPGSTIRMPADDSRMSGSTASTLGSERARQAGGRCFNRPQASDQGLAALARDALQG